MTLLHETVLDDIEAFGKNLCAQANSARSPQFAIGERIIRKFGVDMSDPLGC